MGFLDDAKDRIGGAAERVKDAAQDVGERAKEVAGGVGDRARDATDGLGDRVQDVGHAIGSRAAEAKDWVTTHVGSGDEPDPAPAFDPADHQGIDEPSASIETVVDDATHDDAQPTAP